MCVCVYCKTYSLPFPSNLIKYPPTLHKRKNPVYMCTIILIWK